MLKYFSFLWVDVFNLILPNMKFSMTWIFFTTFIACQKEHFDLMSDLYSPRGDPLPQLTPLLDQIFDPLYDGFDSSIACYIEEDTKMTYKKNLFLEGNIWLQNHRPNWSNPTEYTSFFISDVDGVVHQGLYNTSTSALFPIFWNRLSYGEHIITFVVFNEEDEEPVCMSKQLLWSDYEE